MAANNILYPERNRVNFGKIKIAYDSPDLLEIQVKSFQEFFQLETTPENRTNEGLFRCFQEKFPDYGCTANLQLGVFGLLR